MNKTIMRQTMQYDAKKAWTEFILNSGIAYPAEYVIRIFKGSYPRLRLSRDSFKDKKICDLGCGDGRNMILLKQCGFKVYGVEISQEISNRVRHNLRDSGIKGINIKVGTNENIPYKDEYFDYLLSWEACYYMGAVKDFDLYLREFNRVLKKEGHLILSIPKNTHRIFQDSKKLTKGYYVIKNDHFNIRNGEVFRRFENEDEIKDTFSKYFKKFIFGSIYDDCFGYNYHFHLVICQKK